MMNEMVPQRFTGLGYTITIGTPVGDQKIKIPFEDLVKDVAADAVSTAWPIIRDKLYAELPTLINTAMDKAMPIVRKEVAKIQGDVSIMADEKISDVKTTAGILVGVMILAGFGGLIYWRRNK